ncbi:LysR family transcriptional regulator [Nocardia sp. NPDC056100]|uniref:LysR family transcriptional regulator n=1 Tax=Nocardia sp. NPDC056100 TaxID=3345712 RepID=UPI0035D84808
MELDLGAIRAFITVADHLHFGEAADSLGLTQQAVSKRIAKLEESLDTRLLSRTRGGTRLTDEGSAFLPHARALIALADQAVESLCGGVRPLRVDVLGTRLAATDLIRTFHETYDGVEIDVVTSSGLRSGRAALTEGTIDVAFARVIGALDAAIEHIPAYLEPLYVLVGRNHRFAHQRTVRPTDLAGAIARMPGNEPGSEWAQFYDDLAAEFGLTIDTSGPDFGLDHLLDEIAHSEQSFVFSGERLRVPWHRDIVQIPIVDPTPTYPHSMLWHRRNPHPALPELINHVTKAFRPFDPDRHWLPASDIEAGLFEAFRGSVG